METYSIFGPWPESVEQDFLTVEALEPGVHASAGSLPNPKSRRMVERPYEASSGSSQPD
jgi:hypothetical protein